jgi:hypothetical protein
VLTRRQDVVQAATEECFSFQMHESCPYGDECKYLHIEKDGTVVNHDVKTSVPTRFVCTHRHPLQR